MARRQASSSAVLMVAGAAGRGRGWCRAWGTPQLCPKRQRGHWHLHFPCPAKPFLKTRGTAWRSRVPVNGVSSAGPYPASPPSPAGCCCHPGWKAAGPYPHNPSHTAIQWLKTPHAPSLSPTKHVKSLRPQREKNSRSAAPGAPSESAGTDFPQPLPCGI